MKGDMQSLSEYYNKERKQLPGDAASAREGVNIERLIYRITSFCASQSIVNGRIASSKQMIAGK